MEVLLILVITTSGVSIGTIVKKCLDVIKNVADEGYKIVIDKDNEKVWDEKNAKFNLYFWELFIPGYNLFLAYKIIMSIYRRSGVLADTLEIMGIAKKMSKLEYEEYLKNPTAVNAVLVPDRVKERLIEAITLDVNADGLNGKIIYDYVDGNLKILETTGNLLYLTEEKREELVRNGGVLTKNTASDEVFKKLDGIDIANEEKQIEEERSEEVGLKLSRRNKKIK